MARIINEKYLFIHSAKTGGTFLRETLNRYGVPNFEVGGKHSSFKDVVREYPLTKKLSSFGYVRNPLTWYRSRWAYGMMTYFGEKIKYMPEAFDHWMRPVWSNNLNQFVENILYVYPNGIAYRYFNDMLGIGEEQIKRVSMVYRYENLPYTTLSIVQRNKLEYVQLQDIMKLPRSLDSQQKYKDEISPELKKEIQITEKKLFEMFY